MTVIELVDVDKVYPGTVQVHALRAVNLKINQGELVAITGPSGAGKSTLLNVLALLDTPTSGAYLLDDTDVSGLNEDARAKLRSNTFGFIFQSFHLLKKRSVLDNVALGLQYRGVVRAQALQLAREALEYVGLSKRRDFAADQLSGGERQRVAIARAIVANAPVLVADEPTGNLDSKSSAEIVALLRGLHERGTTVVIVTHDPAIAASCPRQLHVIDGVVSEITPNKGAHVAEATEVIPPVQIPQALGVASKVKWRSALQDVAANLASTPRRTARLVGVVLLGVALALSTLGLGQTIGAQVSSTFDATRNTRVAVAVHNEDSAQVVTPTLNSWRQSTWKKINSVPGVDSSLFFTEGDDIEVATRLGEKGQRARIYGFDDIGVDSSLFTVQWVGNKLTHLADNQILIGQNAAEKLELGPLSADPTVWINGVPYEVVGIIKDAGIRAEMLAGVGLNYRVARQLGEPVSLGLEIKVAPGAAQQVAKAVPLTWDPTQVDAMSVDAPPDPRGLRDQIEGSLQAVLLTLTGVSVLVAVLSLSSAMSGAVHERQGELALRRAIGGRKRHLRVLLALESMFIGFIGGLFGALVAVLAILVVTVVQRWQPVMDPWALPIGMLAGLLTGLLGSLAALRRVAAVQPAQALRG